MVDIHSHILPGWDDGSKSMEESLEMLSIAAASGTTDIVATPHANAEFPYRADAIHDLFEQLKKNAGSKIRVHLGSDFHVQFENVQDALVNPTKYTINHGPYLMVELPEIMNLQVIRDILRRLGDVGIVSVITHPERNTLLQGQPNEIKRLVSEGALVQITGQSLLGRFGDGAQHCSHTLLKADVVHFVASDAHDTKDRTPRLLNAYEVVTNKYGKQRADRLFKTNPQAVIEGAPLSYGGEYELETEAAPWWAFWRSKT